MSVRPRPEPAADPGKQAAAIRARLAEGRSMSALKEAKELAKRHPGPLAEAVLAEAYACRIADLERAGMRVEAGELVKVARSRFPDRAATWAAAEADAKETRGDLSDLLRRWRDEPAQRDALHAELRAKLRDPAAIADCDVLPPDDRLRKEAIGLRTAFVQAAGGGLADDGRAALQAISRRSPLQAWRAFVLALDAFHRHDDDRCRAQLERIADGDSTAAVRDVLRAALLDADVPGSPKQQRAVHRLVGGAPAWRRSAADALRGSGRGPAVAATLRESLTGLATASPRLVLRFLRTLVEAGHEFDHIDHALPDQFFRTALGPDESARLLFLFDRDPCSVVTGLGAWLQTKPGELRRLSDLELATALRRLAEAMPFFAVIMAGVLPPTLDAAWRRGDPLGAELSAFVSGSFELEQEATEMAGVSLVILESLFRGLRQRTGVERSGSDVTVQLLHHVVALDPVAESFELLLAAIERVAADEQPPREPVLEHWAEARPDDVEPLVRLVQDAEERGALRKALAFVERAEAVDGVDERVRRARVRVTLARLRQHWRERKHHLCQKDLEELERLPAFRAHEQRLFASGVRALLAAAAGGGADAAAPPAAPGPEHSAARAVAELALDGTWPVVAGSPADMLAQAAVQCRIARVVGIPYVQLPRGIDPRKLSAEHLPSAPEDLLALCEVLVVAETAPLWFLASGRGMQADGPLLARFLLARTRSLAVLRRNLLEPCGRLTVFHAERLGDGATLAEARRFVRSDEPMTAEEAAKALAAERARATWRRGPAAGGTPRDKKTRRRRDEPRLPFAQPADHDKEGDA